LCPYIPPERHYQIEKLCSKIEDNKRKDTPLINKRPECQKPGMKKPKIKQNRRAD